MDRYKLHTMNVYKFEDLSKVDHSTQQLFIDECGDWVRYEDAAARISNLEARLAAEREKFNAIWESNQQQLDSVYKQLVAANAELEAELAQRTTDTNVMVGNCEARIQELEAQLAAAQERERWIPCRELPSDERRVLITLDDGLMLVGRYNKEGGYDENGAWQDDEYWTLDDPTHWRELPAPPEADHA